MPALFKLQASPTRLPSNCW